MRAKAAQYKNASHLDEVMATIDAKAIVATACLNLATLMTKPPCPSEFLEQLAILKNAGATVSDNMHTMQFQQKLQNALGLNDVESACAMCAGVSPEWTELLHRGQEIQSASHVAKGAFLDSILVLATSGLSTIEQQREPEAGSATKLGIMSIIDTLRKHSKHLDFIARSIVDKEMDEFALLVSDEADPIAVEKFLAGYDTYHSDGSFVDFGALGSFIYDGTIGQGLVNCLRAKFGKQRDEHDACKKVAAAEASGQVVCGEAWDPFQRRAAALAHLNKSIVPFHDMLQDMAGGDNPILNAHLRKKLSRKSKGRDAIVLRAETIAEQTWTHLRKGVLEGFAAYLSEAVHTAVKALENNGDVQIQVEDLDGEPAGKVIQFINLKMLAVKIDQEVSNHVVIKGPAQEIAASGDVVVSKHLKMLRETVCAVDELGQEFLKIAECALVSNVSRFRDVQHRVRYWDSAEIKRMAGFTKALESKLGLESCSTNLGPDVVAGLAKLQAAVVPALSENQKQCYAAVKVLTDLYVEGKHVGEVDKTIGRIPEPTETNKALFNFIVEFLQAILVFFSLSLIVFNSYG